MATSMSDIDEYARREQRAHVRLSKTDPTCRTCGPDTPWPCPTAIWQEQWLGTLNLEIRRSR